MKYTSRNLEVKSKQSTLKDYYSLIHGLDENPRKVQKKLREKRTQSLKKEMYYLSKKTNKRKSKKK